MADFLNHINIYPSLAEYEADTTKQFPNVSYIEENDNVVFVSLTEYQYAIVTDIANYTDSTYEDVYDRKTMQWFKLNSAGQYEQYGVFGTSRNEPYYTGKLVLDEDGYEYEWDGSEWVNVGEYSDTEDWYRPSDQEIINLRYGGLCEIPFTMYRFTDSIPRYIGFSDSPCASSGQRLTDSWEVNTIYETDGEKYLSMRYNEYLPGTGFEMLTGGDEYVPKEYETKNRPIFAKAYGTLQDAKADTDNVGLNAAAILPDDSIYTFTTKGLEPVDDYLLLGRFENTTECLYQPADGSDRTCAEFSSYLPKGNLHTVYVNGYCGTDLFTSCTKLANVSIGENFSMNPDTRLFYNCTALPVVDNIRYADKVAVTVVDKTVENCTFNVREGTKVIGYQCFYGLPRKAGYTFILPGSVEIIGYSAFNNIWLYPNNLILPPNLKHIGGSAFNNVFQGGSKSATITIPDSVETIGTSAFYKCNYYYMTIGSGVKSIGSSAFNTDTSMQYDIYVTCKPETPPVLKGLIWNTPYAHIQNIKIPSASLESYKAAEYWSDYKRYFVGV